MMSESELPPTSGPVRVGLCRDSAPINSTPMSLAGGSRDGGAFCSNYFSHFFSLYKLVSRCVSSGIGIK